MPAFSTSGYGSSSPRTSARVAGRAAPYDPNNAPGNPSRDNLAGRNRLADTRSGEIANERAKFDMSHIDREFGLESQRTGLDLRKGEQDIAMREHGKTQRDRVQDAIFGFFQNPGGAAGGDGPVASGGSMAPPAAVPAGGATPGVPSAADAGYARLKEREGLRLRSGLNANRAALSRGGLLDSNVEGSSTGAIIGGSLGRLADFDAAALADEVGRGRQVEDRNFAAGERRREFDTNQQQQRLNILLQLLGDRAY